ncbi:hypothetical protein BDZ45DRAFT_811768 [Acephala macrosclerotiorum]|nr:hypothetical protein BDZ45DRAFT_811768 [Acephala macrosclerotiorum]
MDKLKNLLHPSRQQDDEALYGSGQITAIFPRALEMHQDLLASGLRGQLVHRELEASTGNPEEASTDHSGRAIGSGTRTGTSGIGGQGSRLSGALDTTSASGLTGNQSSGLGNTSTTTGRQPDLARDAATTAAATTSGNTGFAHQPGSQHGSGRELGTETVTPAAVGSRNASDTAGTKNSHMPGSWDDSYDRGGIGSRTSTGFGSTTADTGHPSTAQGTSQLGSTTEPSIPAQSTNISIGSQFSRDAAAIGTAGAVDEGIHHHRENEQNLGSSTGTTSYPTITQGTRQLGSNPGYGNTTSGSTTGTGSASHLGRDVTALGTAGAVGEGIHHHREKEDGLGSARVLGTTTIHSTRLPSGSAIPSTTFGMEHSGYTSTLPDRAFDSQQPSSASGYGSNTTGNTSLGHYPGRDAAVVGTTGTLESAALHHREDERNLRDQYTGSSDQPGNRGEYTGTTREMPLGSSTRQIGTSASQPTGSNTAYGTQSGNTTSGHHLGRDAAVLGTAGAVGEGIHHHGASERENERGLGSSGPTSGSNAYGSSSSCPHSTDTANLLDPSIHGGPSTLEDAHRHHPQHGGGAEAADKHHMGRDAAIGTGGAGAVGLAEHESNKHHNDRTAGVGNTSTSSQPTTGTTSSRTDPTSTSRDHHYGRDAAIGAGGVGAVGLAAHEHGKHENERGTGVGNTSTTTDPATTSSASRTDPYSTSTSQDYHYERDAALGAGGPAGRKYEKYHNDRSSGVGSSSTTTNPTTTGSTLRTDPATSSSSTSKDHHYGRDAAIGAGGVGAAGLAGHEYEKHHGDNTTGTSGLSQSTCGTSSLPGPAPNTAGPHSKDWMNKLDPRVITNPTVAQGNPQAESTLSSQKPSAETGGYGAGSNTSGHHYGRDAGVASGIGAGTAAPLAYENEQRRLEKPNNPDNKPNDLGNPSASAIGGYPSRDTTTTTNTAQKTDPLADSTKSKDHHYGRDAAIGGVGTAAYEADKHKRDKDLAEAEKVAKKQQKHNEKELEKERKHDQKQMEKEHKHGGKAARKESKGALFGFLHRDKNKKYTPEEEAEFDRQEREHNSYKGRDAALGTAGVGAVGAGAYEAEKHHHTGTDADKPLPYAPGNRGVGTGVGTQDALASDNTTAGQSGHLYGRDAALGTGAAGAAGYAAHEHDKTHGTPLADKPVGRDIGDKLHGAERNRGVAGATSGSDSYPSGSHFHSEASTDQYGNPLDSGVVAPSTGSGYPTGSHPEASSNQYGNPIDQGMTGTSGSQGHHLGRDAALGTGTVGLAAHEHRKHDSRYQPSSTSGYDNNASTSGYQPLSTTGNDDETVGSGLTGSTGQHDNSSSGYAGPQGQTGHHTGRDTAALGGAGALGEHEYRKHDTTSGQHQSRSGLTDSNTSNQYDNTGLGYGKQAGTTGAQDYGSSDTSYKGIGPSVSSASGRNRLHKDPPASHPASGTSHVPASGGETRRLMQEGKQDLHEDTGVANTGNDRLNY